MKRSKPRPWSYSTGERGRNRVQARTDTRTGMLFLECWDRGRRVRVSLRHRDTARAKQQADELAAKLAVPDATLPQATTLQGLFDRYLAERSPMKGASKRAHDRRAAAIVGDILGPHRRADSLTHADADRFVRERHRRGDLRQSAARGRPIRQRVVEYDLRFLRAALNWGVGAGLLDRNPLAAYRIAAEPSPRRPIVTADEFDAMLAKAAEVSPVFRLALVLTHETGHRIGAVSNLRWGDVDLDGPEVRWRAEHDKQGREHVTPLTPAAVQALREGRRSAAAIGDTPVLPSSLKPGQPVGRDVLNGWWRDCERLAELPHVPGRGWHSLRRKFASELKHAPLVDLAALGGWRDTRTILTCYQRPDAVTMRAALADRARLVRG